MVTSLLRTFSFSLNQFIEKRHKIYRIPNLNSSRLSLSSSHFVSNSRNSFCALKSKPSVSRIRMSSLNFEVRQEDKDLVEVTADNFEETFPLIENALNKCDFFAIDGEFTGLFLSDPSCKENLFDSIEERYRKMKTSAQNFLIIQFGLSAFQWEASRNLYSCQTFNFYIFPRPFNNSDLRFTCQASSLEFLSKHGFDFNKFIYKGIPYISLSQLEKEEKIIEEKKTNDNIIILKKEEDIYFIKKQMNSVNAWIQSTSVQASSSPNAESQKMQEMTFLEEGQPPLTRGTRVNETLLLDSCNSYLRACLYQKLDKAYGNESFYAESVQTLEGSAVMLTLADSATIAKRAADKAKEKEMQFHQTIGFARIMRLMTESKKPMVGHNMILDIMYTMQQFIMPLPPTFEEFQKSIMRFFPGGIYDTKYLAKQFPAIFSNSGTSLQTVYSMLTQHSHPDKQATRQHDKDGPNENNHSMKIDDDNDNKNNNDDGDVATNLNSNEQNLMMKFDLSKKRDETELKSIFIPKIIHDKNFFRYQNLSSDEGKAHEAGYDAFMTGSCFCGLLQLFSARNSISMEYDDPPSMAALLPHANKTNIMFSDMDFISLDGPCPSPDRSNVFFVEILGDKYVRTDAILSFCADKDLGNVAVKWIDNRSFFVSILDTEKVSMAMDVLAQNKALKWSVKTFEQYEKQKSSNNSKDDSDGSEEKDKGEEKGKENGNEKSKRQRLSHL